MKNGTKNLTESELHYMESQPCASAIRIGRTKPYYLVAKEKLNVKENANQREKE